jgi:hypothetical protein
MFSLFVKLSHIRIMKKYFLATTAALLLLGSGCMAPTLAPNESLTEDLEPAMEPLTADFEPAVGAAASPDPNPKAEGPWTGRFMTAVSTDGLIWTKTGNIVGDQLNVPDLVYGPNGELYLYFSGYTLGKRINKTAVAISLDDGETWIFKYLEFNGFDRDMADVTVQYRDSEFWLYGTYLEENDPRGTYLAKSTDGLHFTRVGKAFVLDEVAMVPSVLQVNGRWHIYANKAQGGPIWHGVSSDDGLTFDLVEEFDMKIDGKQYFVGNGVPVDGGYRLYAYTRAQSPGVIGSFFSKDGYTWESEGIVLEVTLPALEAKFVKDPAVIQRPDETWFMVYPTDIP